MVAEIDPELGPDPASLIGWILPDTVRLEHLNDTLGKVSHIVQSFNDRATREREAMVDYKINLGTVDLAGFQSPNLRYRPNFAVFRLVHRDAVDLEIVRPIAFVISDDEVIAFAVSHGVAHKPNPRLFASHYEFSKSGKSQL